MSNQTAPSFQAALRRRRRQPNHQGFTLVELLVVIAIIAVLAALLMPALGRARYQSRFAACSSNLRQIAAACTVYASDWNGYYPGYRPDPHAKTYRASSHGITLKIGGESMPELGPYCGGSVDNRKAPLWRCPEGYRMAQKLGIFANGSGEPNNYYSVYANIQCGLYGGTYKWDSMTTGPNDQSNMLQRPDGSMRVAFFQPTWGPASGLRFKILASDICDSGVFVNHAWGGVAAQGGYGGLGWNTSNGRYSANYAFTDGSVQRYDFGPTVSPNDMVLAVNGPVDWNSYYFPKAWGQTP